MVKKTVDLQDSRPHVKYFTNWLLRMLGTESYHDVGIFKQLKI